MKRLAIPVLLLCLLALAILAGGLMIPSAAHAGVSTGISGVVTDTADHRLSGMDVAVYRQSEWWFDYVTTVRSDAAGAFKVTSLEAGTYRLQATDPSGGFLAVWYGGAWELWTAADVTVSQGSVTPRVDIRLLRSGSISGTVSEEDGTPIPGASVYAEISGQYWSQGATTDDMGHYKISGLRPTGTGESYSMTVWAAEFHSGWLPGAVPLNEGQAQGGVDVRLSESERIQGRVTSSSGTPIETIRVSLWRWYEWYGWYETVATTTDEDGRYDLSPWEAGEYRVQFSDPAGVLPTRYYGGVATIEEAVPVEVAYGEIVTGIDMLLEPLLPGSISGTITGTGGAPLSGATVTLYQDYWNPIARVTSGFDGSYRFDDLSPSERAGDYFIEVAADGHVTRFYDGILAYWSATPISLGSGQDISTVDVQLLPPDTSCAVSGVVRDFRGEPLPGIEVDVTRVDSGLYEGVATTSAADGSYRVDGLAPGTYTVLFWADGYNGTFYGAEPGQSPGPEAEFVLASGQTRDDIDMVMHAWNVISGRVTMRDGTPISGAFLYIYGAEYGNEMWADDNGEYSVQVGPGTYYVRFLRHGEWLFYDGKAGEEDATPITFPSFDGARTGVDGVFDMPGARIEGTVTASDGGGVAGVEVYASVKGWDGTREVARTTVAADGAYSLAGLDPDTYYVGFYDPQERYGGQFADGSALWTDARPYSLAKNEVVTGCDAMLGPGGDITGRVIDSEGRPVAGAVVTAHYQGLWYGGCGTAGEFTRSVTTGEDGIYDVAHLTAGRYRVEFAAPSGSYLIPAWYQGAEWPSDSPVEVTADQTTAGIDQQLDAGGRIGGSITVADGSAYTSGGTVLFSRVDEGGTGYEFQSVFMAKDGSFLTKPLSPGTYRVGFEPDPPYVATWWQDKPSYSSGDLVTVVVGETTTIDPVVRLQGSISGTVTDADGPVERYADEYGGPVDLYRQRPDGGWSFVGNSGTDQDGVYTFTGLAAGTYRIDFRGEWGSNNAAEWWQDVHPGDMPDDIELDEGQHLTGIDAFLDAEGTAAGRVTDVQGLPIQGIVVTAYSWSWSPWSGSFEQSWEAEAWTDADGRYALALRPGSYTVNFTQGWWWNGGYVETSSPVEVSSGQTTAGVDAVLRSRDVTITSSTHPNQERWYSATDVSVSWTQRDPSFVTAQQYAYSWGSGTEWAEVDPSVTSAGFQLTGEGYCNFWLNVWYENGDSSSFPFTVRIDQTPPDTIATGEGDAWHNTPVRLRYAVADSLSGVARTWTKVDGGTPVKGSSYKLLADGVHSVSYWSVDNAGNVEDPHSTTVRIDRTPPVTTQTGADDGWHNLPVTVGFAAADATVGMSGGLAKTEYSLDQGATWTTGTSVTVKGAAQGGTDGHHPIWYRSADALGNLEQYKMVDVRLDTRVPSTVVLAAVTMVKGSTAPLTYMVKDPEPTCGTAVATVVIRDENDRIVATLPPTDGAVNVTRSVDYTCTLKPGSYRYFINATDGAGNKGIITGSGKLVVSR